MGNTPYVGVHYHKPNTYSAIVSKPNGKYGLKYFRTAELAAAHRDFLGLPIEPPPPPPPPPKPRSDYTSLTDWLLRPED